MASIDARILRAIALVLFYGIFFWRLFKNNRGDKFIQCASITVMLFVVLMALTRIPNFPIDPLAEWLAIPLFMLCMLTLFFGFRQGYRALRNRKIQKHDKATSSATSANGGNRTA